MITVPHLVETLQRLLGEEADQVAREVGFIQRQRAFSGADFAQGIIFGWLQDPDISLDGLTQVLERRAVTITASGLTQRFTPQSVAFLHAILDRLSAEQMHVEPVEAALLKRFTAVILEDSSVITLPSELVEVWRGCGGSGVVSGAALKLFVRWDVLSGRISGPGVTDGRCNDHRGPLAVDELPDGSLYLADLGFFGVERLRRIAQGTGEQPRQRFFVSRLQVKTVLLTHSGHRLVLEGVLPQQVGQVVEFGALVGGAGRLPVRVIAQRVPEAVAEQRRERIHDTAQAQGREADETVLWLASWTLVVTNVPRERLTLGEVLVLLRLRWQIERLFRLWKEDGKIDDWRGKGPWRILTELYAKLAAMVIQQWLIQLGCWQDPHRSVVKAAQVVRREAGHLMVALFEGRAGQAIMTLLRCMQSGCRLNTRKQAPTTSQYVMGTPLPWINP